jgi:hypothetical protein
MANKITETISLRLAGTQSAASMAGTVTTDQVGTNYVQETQNADSSTAAALDITAGITEGNLGYLMIRNLATPNETSSNTVDVATDAQMTNKIATILPGKGAFIPPPAGTVALWIKANVTDCQIAFLAIEK